MTSISSLAACKKGVQDVEQILLFADIWMPFKTCTQRKQSHLTESQQQLSDFSATWSNWIIPNLHFQTE